jgi:riboflavin kinase/FMN adenylyltransferase
MENDSPTILQGTVQRYKGNGRKLGYPTANIDVPTTLRDGIYFGFANLASYKHQPALIFIGTPTTLGDTLRRVEAHLLDIPNVDHYRQSLTLDIRHFHRTNQKFDTIDALVAAIHADEAAGRTWFAKNE